MPQNAAMSSETTADFLIVGAGIAAASIGYALASRGKVVQLERESQPGYHSTGRSAALFIESYGTPQVRALTMASRNFLEHPPAGFTDTAILALRGVLMLATPEQLPMLDEQWQVLRSISDNARRLDVAEACERVPVLRRDRIAGALLEPDASDIDVHALHQGYLRGLRQRGGRVVGDAEVRALTRRGGIWHVEAGGQTWQAPVVVNAAGAWCDVVGRLAGAQPIGLVPKRRSAFVFAPPAGVSVLRWPSFVSVDESWYVKPDAGQLLGSPANADPVEPHDVQPEELDIAVAIDRIESMTTLRIVRPSRTWAGLRSFVADGDLVGGYDPDLPGFFWVAAQGGYGIQTSAAMGHACAALAAGEPIPAEIARFGLTEAMLSPARLRHAATNADSP
ncbi:MAG: FAD-binding oxidoreductase [Caldimonas sp.]